jgi:hypothetical protein
VVDAEFCLDADRRTGGHVGKRRRHRYDATFVPPVAGSYTFQLVVNDGPVFSAPAPITITIPVLRHMKRGGRSFSSSGK